MANHWEDSYHYPSITAECALGSSGMFVSCQTQNAGMEKSPEKVGPGSNAHLSGELKGQDVQDSARAGS